MDTSNLPIGLNPTQAHDDTLLVRVQIPTKLLLDELKTGPGESYNKVIERLIKFRTFDIINGEIVHFLKVGDEGWVQEMIPRNVVDVAESK